MATVVPMIRHSSLNTENQILKGALTTNVYGTEDDISFGRSAESEHLYQRKHEEKTFCFHLL